MTSSTSPKSIEEKLYLATRVPLPRPEFLAGLRAKLVTDSPQPLTIIERLKKGFHRTRYATVFSVLLILITTFVIFGPQKVIAAVQELIGYIPGFGFVENAESVRILAVPVSDNQDGITMTIEEAVADAKSTRINVRLDGYSNVREFFFQPSEPDIPLRPRHLVLADGTEMLLESWSVEVDSSSLFFRLFYAPLPDEIMNATLVFDQISSTLTGKGVGGWQIPLYFKTSQIGERIAEAAPLLLSSQEVNGITMSLESVAQPAGKSVLKVGVQTNDPALHVEPSWVNKLVLEDQDGRNLLSSSTSGSPSSSILFDQDGFDAVAIGTPVLEPGKPYTLRLQGPVGVFQNIPAEDPDSRFDLDLGENPQLGQSWKLEQKLEAAGQELLLTSAHLVSGNTCDFSNSTSVGKASLAFEFAPHPGVSNIMVSPLGQDASRIYQRACVLYPEVPSGVLEFKISNISFSLDGNWEIVWKTPLQ